MTFRAVHGSQAGLSTALFEPAKIGSGSVGIAIIFAVASFIGFEATAIFRDEARDPAKTIPRATYTALLLIAGFYALSAWAVVSAWGDEAAVAQAAADPGNMLITTVGNHLGAAGSDIAQVLLVTSMVAAVLSFHNVLARYVFSLGNSGALPASCGRSHGRHGSPHVASIVQTVSALVLVGVCAVAGMDPVTQVFAWMSGTATVGVLALMTMTCLAVLVFFRRTKADRRVWHTVVAPALGFAGLVGCLALTIGNFRTLIGGSATLAIVIGAVLVSAFVLGLVLHRVLRPAAASTAVPELA